MAVVGWQVGLRLGDALDSSGYVPWGLALTIVGVALGALAVPYVMVVLFRVVLQRLRDLSISAFVAAIAGLILGLVVASLVSIPLSRISGWPGIWIPVGLSINFGVLGVAVMVGTVPYGKEPPPVTEPVALSTKTVKV